MPKEVNAELNMNVSLFAQIQDFNEAYAFALRHIGAEIEAEREPELIESSDGNGAE